MTTYIERDVFRKHLMGDATKFYPASFAPGIAAASHEAMVFPAADVAPVVHGRWEDKPTGAYGRWQSWCSACGKHSGIGGIESNRHKLYCPNCGASMKDGE